MTIPNPTLVAISQGLLIGTFVCYVLATLLYGSGTLGKRFSQGSEFSRTGLWGTRSLTVGVILHGGAILARWQGAGHWPTSNMYEFVGFMAFTSMLAFLVIDRLYQLHAVGALLAPVGTFLLAYSYVFPPKIAPLVAPLKSYWLPIHVSLAALGEGFFAVAFGAAMMYLLRARGLELSQAVATSGAAAGSMVTGTMMASGAVVTGTMASAKSARVGSEMAAAAEIGLEVRRQRWEKRWGNGLMEVLFYGILVMVGFTLLALIFRYSGFQWLFEKSTYHLPPLVGPVGAEVGEKGDLFGLIPMPLVIAPFSWRGKNLNTLLYSLAMGGILYWIIRRFITRGPIGDALARRVGGDLELLDEISYRAVAIGYPIFTLGGLVFAMLWAKEAWGSYWFWDPKETWALIAWLVYSAYLHFRITRGWEGRRSAWIAVLGFGVVLFTLIGVNLLIVGVHSYAGGDM